MLWFLDCMPSDSALPGSGEALKCAPPVSCCSLRQVVTERGEDHILVRVRLAACARSSRRASNSPPRVAHEVRILHAELERSLWSLVEAIPEPDRAFDQVPRITRAIAQGTGNEPRGAADAGWDAEVGVGGRAGDRKGLRPATGVVQARISVSFVAYT